MKFLLNKVDNDIFGHQNLFKSPTPYLRRCLRAGSLEGSDHVLSFVAMKT